MVEQFSEDWNWYSILRDYAGGDLTRIDEMAGLNLNTVLIDLTYQHHRNRVQDYLNRKKQ